ncbi:Heparinase II/III-like protein [Indibacter alkaliphilus LW1]|uniref:Heparinase II/III-like protein n=1 Tax=Indibacter alkaliphilus (strain CCUG 57479 / KCTC 22604 / LW1) TaxID=1189612 RepID=S2D4J7_INDAL|nr:heparinase II/III family protein [Indibacter alkaliphilus]EOZ93854.1 Heparinase II/III-like protein [Indibacter alkaliphilus LW1]
MPKIKTLLHTLSYLKPIQAVYQVKNRLLPKKPLKAFSMEEKQTNALPFFKVMPHEEQLNVEPDGYLFHFLNLRKKYGLQVDWNDQSHGKLWNYNLQYLDYLKLESLDTSIKVKVILDLYSWLWDGRLPLEPYPASLRIMNIIRFLESHELQNEDAAAIKRYLQAEANYLSQNLEYHLLANHLLENAFALWMAAHYFDNKNWIAKAQKLLSQELEEQILPDGAHYELAPMYHQIILFRVLEAYHYTPVSFVLNQTLKTCAGNMLAWMQQMTFEDGSFPYFNDSTEKIALPPQHLKRKADVLGIEATERLLLGASGYRRMEVENMVLIADVEGIQPSYQPGHAHADTFSFVLQDGENPLIVDPGISTYNISPRRDWERSTAAHNTVCIDDQNSSEVWAGFRVGKRAKVTFVKDSPDEVIGIHDGYGKCLHQRGFQCNELVFVVRDELQGSFQKAEAHLHFHFEVDLEPVDEHRFLLNKSVLLEVQGASSITLDNYEQALGYNLLKKAQKLVIRLESNVLETRIYKNP